MASKVRCVLLCLVILVVVQLEWAVAFENFNNKCGQTIDISTDDSVQLKSQSSLYYDNNVDCTVTIQTSIFKKVLVTFWAGVGIETSTSCSADYLEIYDGPAALVFNKLTTICGTSLTQPAVVSTLNSITLRFKTDSLITGSGFYIVLTSFSTGYCGSSDFECDNGRCIDISLKNDLFNNCGDSSDESYADLVNNVIGLGIGIIVAIIVGAIVGSILVCVCCGCLCYHLCCKNNTAGRNTNTTVIVPAGNQRQQPGGYIQQQPGAPPPAYNQPPMAMQQPQGQQYGQQHGQQQPYTVKT